jgi:bifunctional pyridoxal-dependent enzyme with beta-cystathionase and maltose regulon repressor activities
MPAMMSYRYGSLIWIFSRPPCVIEALAERVQDGIFGYTHAPDNLRSAIAGYLAEHYHWEVDPDWIVILPSVVSGLYTAVRQLTNPTEHILVPQPVYHHLRLACSEGPRAYTEIPLVARKRSLGFAVASARSISPNQYEISFALQSTKSRRNGLHPIRTTAVC